MRFNSSASRRVIRLSVLILLQSMVYQPLQAQNGGLGGMGGGFGGGGGMGGFVQGWPITQSRQSIEVDGRIVQLPNGGVLPVKKMITLGGVSIGERTCLALVLSSDPLVLVTGKDILESDEELASVTPPGALMRFAIQMMVVQGDMLNDRGMGMGGGGGGLGGTGGHAGHVQPEKGQLYQVTTSLYWAPHSAVQFRRASDLVFLFCGGSDGNNPFAAHAPAKLATAPKVDDQWEVWAWPEAEVASLQTDKPYPSPSVAIAADGSTSLIVRNETYGKADIMKSYLHVFQELQSPQESEGATSSDPFADSTDQPPNETADSNPFVNQGSSSDDNVYGQYRSSDSRPAPPDRIVSAVIDYRKATSSAEKSNSLVRLRELLGLEFDAHRSLKATELESLRGRLQQLEQAEAKLTQQREETIEKRLQRLIDTDR